MEGGFHVGGQPAVWVGSTSLRTQNREASVCHVKVQGQCCIQIYWNSNFVVLWNQCMVNETTVGNYCYIYDVFDSDLGFDIIDCKLHQCPCSETFTRYQSRHLRSKFKVIKTYHITYVLQELSIVDFLQLIHSSLIQSAMKCVHVVLKLTIHANTVIKYSGIFTTTMFIIIFFFTLLMQYFVNLWKMECI